MLLYSCIISKSLLTFLNPWEGTLAIAERIDYEKLQNFTVNISAKVRILVNSISKILFM